MKYAEKQEGTNAFTQTAAAVGLHGEALPDNAQYASPRHGLHTQLATMAQNHTSQKGGALPVQRAVAPASGDGVVQRLEIEEFNEFQELLDTKAPGGIAQHRRRQWTTGFLNWFRQDLTLDGTVGEHGMDNMMEFVQSHHLTDELLDGYIAAYREFKRMFPVVRTRGVQETDLVVNQGEFKIISSASMLREGIRAIVTVGVAPCVAIGMSSRNHDDESDQVYALAHFDSATKPAFLVEMYHAVVKAAKEPAKARVAVFIAGGTNTGGDSEAELGGRALFDAVKKLALDGRVTPQVDSVEDRLSVDNEPVNVRLHEQRDFPAGRMTRFLM